MSKKIVFVFGRFQGITFGHKKLIDKTIQYAQRNGAEHRIYTSRTHDSVKNPIPYDRKIIHLRKIFPYANIYDDNKPRVIYHIAKGLSDEGYDDVTMIVGQDRVEDFKNAILKFVKDPKAKDYDPKKHYGFRKFNVVSAGDRDPDAEDVTGASGTKMREFVRTGDFESFAKNTPTKNAQIARAVFNDMRKNLKEDRDPIGHTLSRDLMPQITNPDDFISHLKDDGVESHRVNLHPDDLKSSQMEFDGKKVRSMMAKPSKKPIIVSNDGHIMDGHHRWLADKKMNRKVDAHHVDLPILDLITRARTYTTLTEESDIDHKGFKPLLDTFIAFACKELGLDDLPSFELMKKDDNGQSFGGYHPNSNHIVVATKDRHPMDIFRTVAHELCHHMQNLEGRIKDVAQEGGTGSDIENEANAKAGVVMRNFAKSNPECFGLTHVTEEVLEEGLNDPAKFKVVFLGGGPGSGKDYVLDMALKGHGMTEINSDQALEMIMKQSGLSLAMPPEEEEQKDKARDKGKKTIKQRGDLQIQGRKGIIINGTADDPNKILKLKKKLENLGYDAKMVFVHTDDNTSRERNLDRGKIDLKTGKPIGRTVPENVRSGKWETSQASRDVYRKMFGRHYHEVDNSVDLRTAHPEVKQKVLKQFGAIWKEVRKFTKEAPSRPQAHKWLEGEMKDRGIQKFKPPKAHQTLPSQHDSDAKRMGLAYLGWGRYGRKDGTGHGVTTHYVKDNKLIPKQQLQLMQQHQLAEDDDTSQEDVIMSKMKRKKVSKKGEADRKLAETINDRFDTFLEGAVKPSDREEATDSLADTYAKDTPGEGKKKGNEIVVHKSPKGWKIGGPGGRADRSSTTGRMPVFGSGSSSYATGINEGLIPLTEEVLPDRKQIIDWALSETTKQRFGAKYGPQAAEKIIETAYRLETMNESGITGPKRLRDIKSKFGNQ